MAKHRICRIYCCPVKVLNEFMERWKNKSWSEEEEEDRDDIEFWEQQKKEYLEQNPTHILAIAEMEANDEEDDISVDCCF